MNGSISDGEPFASTTPGVPPLATKNNPDWGTSNAFSSAFDAFSSDKIEHVSSSFDRLPRMAFICILILDISIPKSLCNTSIYVLLNGVFVSVKLFSKYFCSIQHIDLLIGGPGTCYLRAFYALGLVI